jgi:two-component system, chemotaxis family, response regulator Rcp1
MKCGTPAGRLVNLGAGRGRIPCRSPPEEDELTKEALAAPESFRILLIEDNAADAELIRYALDAGHFRYKLTTLRDGEEALAFIRREGAYADAMRQQEVIVMDLHLPRHDGIEVLQEIRRSEEFADLPVAVLSTLVSPEEKDRIEAFGKTCIITKPGNLDGFLEVAKRIRKLARESKAGAVL